MRIQPRQQLLEVWRAVARSSFDDGRWVWSDQRNSIRDAEQLLCLLGPTTDFPSLRFDLPDQTAGDVLDALDLLGDSIELPQRLIDATIDYLDTYVDGDGAPLFSGGNYFIALDGAGPAAEPTAAQQALDVVDAFSASVRLALAAIGFARVFGRIITRRPLQAKLERLEAMASARLTAAMIGLLRSFSINVFDASSREGDVLGRMLNGDRPPDDRMLDELRRELREVNAGLSDLSLGYRPPSEIDNENKLFECGWSWGVVRGAPVVDIGTPPGRQPDGVAEAAPYLYFTVVALDCIEELFSEQTRLMYLLDEHQQRLAQALQVRWDLTQSYWSKIARFGRGRWPLEDIPWRTTDNVESDYLTLLVSSIVVEEFSNRAALDPELSRVGAVLAELASRARITRRALAGDQALQLHHPGLSIELGGSEDAGGPPLGWLLSDFSPQLLRQLIRVAELQRDIRHRTELISLADQVWYDHLLRRRHDDGAGFQLWDEPRHVFPGIAPGKCITSWYYTERVVRCLGTAARFLYRPPQPSGLLADLATDLLAEADHLFDQEMLNDSAESGRGMRMTLQAMRATLRRAHDMMAQRPGTAVALASGALVELDRLRATRDKAAGGG
jgi:hypothetical protein